MGDRLRIELLGGLRVYLGDRTITRFRTRKAGALLGYLAYYPARTHRREALIEILWPEGDPEAGLNSFRVALSSLRRQLEPPGSLSGTVLHADRLAVSLNPLSFITDVAEFENAIRAAEEAGSDSAKIEFYIRAVELYRGELLAGYDEPWLLPEQERLSGLFLMALDRLIAPLERQGNRQLALHYAHRAIESDPFQEERYRDVMRLHLELGQPGLAVKHYEKLKRLLRSEMGTAPGKATRLLAREARKSALTDSETANISLSPELPTSPPTFRMGVVPSLLACPDDIEGLPGHSSEAFSDAMADYHALLEQEPQRHRGYIVDAAEDALRAVFGYAGDALQCAVAIQKAIAAHNQSEGRKIPAARLSLYMGEAPDPSPDGSGEIAPFARQMAMAGHGGQILCSEEMAVLLRRQPVPGLRLTDLGLYRLKNAPVPERLFQVDYPGMPRSSFPPLRAAAAYERRLPLRLTRFFGREEEIAWLKSRLLSGETRLVTLTGPAGSGKTRLALEAGERLLEPFRGEVVYVPLADLTDALRLPEAVLEAMDTPRSPQTEPMEQAVAALSQRGPCLLILDNFEHLVESGATAARTFLERVPGLVCLVTSRQRLEIEGETEYKVMPLPIPEATAGPESLWQCASVQLLVDRAQSVRPDFQVTRDNAPVIAGICGRLEGIPLALELAAARAGTLSPARMLSQLERRLDLPASRRRDIVPRHRTLKAAIDWSYRLLSPEVQRFFRCLSVFRGGWTVEAAEAVCQEPEAAEYLARLTECSMILTEESGPDLRYRMLEMLREYGQEQLCPQERETLERRHADYFLALAEEAENTDYADPWFHRLQAEHDNYRRALDWSRRHGQSIIQARLAAALHIFWYWQGYWQEGRAWLEEVLTRSEGLPDPLRVRLLYASGLMANQLADYPSATVYYEASRTLYRQLQDRAGEAAAVRSLGWLATLYQADYRQARHWFAESLALFQALADSKGIAQALEGFAFVADVQGDAQLRGWVDDQRKRYPLSLEEGSGATALSEEEKLAQASRSDNKLEQANIYRELGNNAFYRGEYALAQSFFERVLILRRDLGDKRGVARIMNALGCAAMLQGAYTSARSLLEEALRLHQEIGDRRLTSMPLLNLGDNAFLQGDYDTARMFLEESLAMCREIGYQRGEALAVGDLGELECESCNYDKAQSLLHACLKVLSCSCAKDQRDSTPYLEAFAKLALARKQYRRAARLLGSSASLRESKVASLPPARQPERDRQIALLRETLGEKAFEAAWDEGRSMTYQQAVAYALSDQG